MRLTLQTDHFGWFRKTVESTLNDVGSREFDTMCRLFMTKYLQLTVLAIKSRSNNDLAYEYDFHQFLLSDDLPTCFRCDVDDVLVCRRSTVLRRSRHVSERADGGARRHFCHNYRWGSNSFYKKLSCICHKVRCGRSHDTVDPKQPASFQ